MNWVVKHLWVKLVNDGSWCVQSFDLGFYEFIKFISVKFITE
jgi:hypothetical protein